MLRLTILPRQVASAGNFFHEWKEIKKGIQINFDE
jgi:hypothetical protein